MLLFSTVNSIQKIDLNKKSLRQSPAFNLPNSLIKAAILKSFLLKESTDYNSTSNNKVICSRLPSQVVYIYGKIPEK